MKQGDKIATRQAYGEALAELGKEHENLYVLDADLAGATKTAIFQKAFPERFIDCGIAEADLMGIAAGLATTGKIPFASSFAMFAAGRAYEQVRNSIGYPHLNVKIGATHAGISVGEDGATHQCNEDIALMRTIPGMTVIVPSDGIEARAAVRAAYAYDGPVYLRFSRLVTVEEHSVIGGLGGAVTEYLSETHPVPILRLGVNDQYGHSGPAADLLHEFRLDGEGVYWSIKDWLVKSK